MLCLIKLLFDRINATFELVNFKIIKFYSDALRLPAIRIIKQKCYYYYAPRAVLVLTKIISFHWLTFKCLPFKGIV